MNVLVLDFEVPEIIVILVTYLICYVIGIYTAYNLGKIKGVEEALS